MTSLVSRSSLVSAAATAGLVIFGAAPARAHFVLESPDASLSQDAQGNPQKMGPCGGNGTATGKVTTFAPGDTITIKIKETIFHPGHYRVALSTTTPQALPADPKVTPASGDQCDSAEIQEPATFPVLVDGALKHTTQFSGSQTFDVKLPSDVTCDNCTLQVLEFMSEHGAPCFYYHCANIAIKGTPSGGGGASAGGQAGSDSGGAAGAVGGSAGRGGAAAGGTGSTAGTGATGAPLAGAGGAPSTGGAMGNGGANSTFNPIPGGAPGAAVGGSVGAGGAPGASGATPAGSPSVAGSHAEHPAASTPSEDDGGGCGIAPQSPGSGAGFAGALLPLALTLLWRRRRSA